MCQTSAMQLVLTLNGGSSSIRFALYELPALRLVRQGKIERIGSPGTQFSVDPAVPNADPAALQRAQLIGSDHHGAARWLLDWLAAQPEFVDIAVVGHRIVNGLSQAQPRRIDAALRAELATIRPYDPEHLPRELELIELLAERWPALPQVACFDTAFHRTMPRVATLLPLPRRYAAQGLQRYGFHGLSYAYLVGELRRLGDPAATSGRVILAHLGNGASMAAVRDGCSIDTSMGFSPASGLPMSSRSGDLDPCVGYFLATTEAMSPRRFQTLVNHEAGLLGVSETSSDVRDLLEREAGDVRAAEALALFCYQAKKWLGAFVAALGGLDTLVFAGGIGENAPQIRARILSGLEFLGVDVNAARNAAGAGLISSETSRVRVRVVRTDEEVMIARQSLEVLGAGRSSSQPAAS